MNKTVTINISGIIFHIEEDAYDSLSKYLAAIKGHFSNTDGGNEIMADIEARVAELLQGKINTSKQVILMADVDQVKNIMGKPEEFGAEPTKEENSKSQNENFDHAQEKTKRRLFRNPDEKTIGGVCSGLAAYFDIDTVWVRLAMFLLIFFGGISIWVYIVLWIVIPQAKTTADKFAMRGESANINTIYQSFKEEADDVKNRFAKQGRDYKQQFSDVNSTVRTNFAAGANGVFNVLGRLIGLFLLFIGGILLFCYIMSLLGISILYSNAEIAKWKSVIFESSSDYALALFAFIIVTGIPVFMLIYGGVKLLFKIRYSNRWLNLSLGFLWIIGLIMGFYVTVSALKQFSETSKLKEVTELHGMGDTIIVKLNPALANLKTFNFDNADELDVDRRHNNGYHFGEIGKNLSIIGFADLDVIESSSDSVELVVNQSAKGGSKKEANANAKAIHYSYQRVGNELIFDELFSVESGSRFRFQELDIKLKLPKGKVIYFDKSVKQLLNDVDNTTNTWDGDMISRRWKMTDKGLQCIDCKDLDNIGDSNKDDDDNEEIKTKNITINDDGIKVNGKDAEIKIDEDGIRIKTQDKDLQINNTEKEKEEFRKEHHKDNNSKKEKNTN